MMEGTLTQAAESMHGTLSGLDHNFRGVSTDTRTLRAGELFFALQGPNFDGNRFIEIAAEHNAAGAVVSRGSQVDLPNIEVDDTRIALGILAAEWRRQMPATVVGVTGSNGKTTLRELIASCLSQSSETLATRGNLNNDIGVPLSLLRLDKKHCYAVIELGANHPGEIASLAEIAEPDVVVISNAAPAHLEGFGSLEGVSRGKAEILLQQKRPRIAVLNADDQFFSYWSSLVQDIDLISFGVENEATITASDVEAYAGGSRFTLRLPGQDLAITLPLPGAHNVLNACAAAAVAYGLQTDARDIKKGLESVTPVAGRLQPITGVAGASLYDDSYNANPASVMAAAKFLAEKDGESFLVLGDMGELGSDEVILHSDVGHAAKRVGVNHLLATGELSRHTVAAFGDGGEWYENVDALLAALTGVLTGQSSVLVKGSRSMRMERVVDGLRESTVGQQET
jgi:UDP-N-acetylmuramoyl-tripeptide--D-alanyl-D-alanine ligase